MGHPRKFVRYEMDFFGVTECMYYYMHTTCTPRHSSHYIYGMIDKGYFRLSHKKRIIGMVFLRFLRLNISSVLVLFDYIWITLHT